MGRTREMRYRLQPADKSKVIGPSGILRSRTTKSTASTRYVATYVHMYIQYRLPFMCDVRMYTRSPHTIIMCVYMYIYIHTYIYTYIHSYIYT